MGKMTVLCSWGLYRFAHLRTSRLSFFLFAAHAQMGLLFGLQHGLGHQHYAPLGYLVPLAFQWSRVSDCDVCGESRVFVDNSAADLRTPANTAVVEQNRIFHAGSGIHRRKMG